MNLSHSENCPPLLSSLLLTSPVPHAHLLKNSLNWLKPPQSRYSLHVLCFKNRKLSARVQFLDSKNCPNYLSLPNFVSLNHLMLVWRITLLRLLPMQLHALHSIPNKQALCVISGLRLGVKKIFVLLGCYAAQIDSYLPTFRDPPETSANNYQSARRDIPKKERRLKLALFMAEHNNCFCCSSTH